MRRFHKSGDEKRSMVILPSEDYHDRLYADAREARGLLKPFPAKEFIAEPAPKSGHNPAIIFD